MPIPLFPIPFPQQGVFTEVTLTPNRRQAAGVLASGNDFVIDRGAPQWTASWKTRTLTAFEMGLWRAWAASLRGASRFFLGYDPEREYPLAYMPSGWGGLVFPASGVTVSAVTASLDQVSLQNLPPTLELVNGDYLSIAYGAGLVSLHVLLSSGTADNTGAISDLWVEPELPTAIGAGAAVSLYQPCAKWRVTKFAAPRSAEGGLRVGACTIGRSPSPSDLKGAKCAPSRPSCSSCSPPAKSVSSCLRA